MHLVGSLYSAYSSLYNLQNKADHWTLWWSTIIQEHFFIIISERKMYCISNKRYCDKHNTEHKYSENLKYSRQENALE